MIRSIPQHGTGPQLPGCITVRFCIGALEPSPKSLTDPNLVAVNRSHLPPPGSSAGSPRSWLKRKDRHWVLSVIISSLPVWSSMQKTKDPVPDPPVPEGTQTLPYMALVQISAGPWCREEPETCEAGGKMSKRRLLLAGEDISRGAYVLWLLGHCTYPVPRPSESRSLLFQNTACALGFRTLVLSFLPQNFVLLSA